MAWILLTIVAVSIVGAVAVLHRGKRVRRRPSPVAYRQRFPAEQAERPHRNVAHYRASGALPRWDP